MSIEPTALEYCIAYCEGWEHQDVDTARAELSELREKAAVLDRLEAAFATPTVYTWEVIPPHVQKERLYCLLPISNVVSIDGETPIELYCGSTIAEALDDFEAKNGGAE